MNRIVIALAALASNGASALAAGPPGALTPFLEEHCFDCHDDSVKKGGLDLTGLGSDLTETALQAVWIRVHDRVRDGEMPPPKKARPEPSDLTAFLGMLGAELSSGHAKSRGTVLRRLNRTEYENTLNDLLGVREALAEMLPEDGTAAGFDNVGEGLDLSSAHLERYLEAAGTALRAAVRKNPKPESTKSSHSLADGKGRERIGKHWQQLESGEVVLFSSGNFPRPVFESFRAPSEGEYRVRLTAHARNSSDPISVDVWHGTFQRSDPSAKAATLGFAPGKNETKEIKIWLQTGEKILLFPGLHGPTSLGKTGSSAYEGPGLAVAGLEVEGPLFDSWPGPGHELMFGGLASREIEPTNAAVKRRSNYRPQFEIVSADPMADAERLLKGFLPVAFRRPTDEEDLRPLLELVAAELEAGAGFEDAMLQGYAAALCAPDFLFLRESEGALDAHALAARLSYGIWNTMPDAQLRQVADSGELLKPKVLHQEAERLLADSRAERMIRTFTGQWLNLREIDFTTPDKQLYPEYDDALKEAMTAETEMFFATVLRENLSVLNFVESDWTVVNERLAKHYGIEGVSGFDMRKVSLKPEHRRGGVLTHASVLKVSANGSTTSPVVRGIFVMERILGQEPPPPPPGVPGIEPDIRGAASLRDQLEKHREMESCAGCHRIIDPPGFALENYDVMGGWRDHYRSLNKEFPTPAPEQRAGMRNVAWRLGPEVDASGENRDGRRFQNLAEYKSLLLEDPEKIAHAMTEKLATYLAGRPMGFSDRAVLDKIVHATAVSNYGLRDLLHGILASDLFRSK